MISRRIYDQARIRDQMLPTKKRPPVSNLIDRHYYNVLASLGLCLSRVALMPVSGLKPADLGSTLICSGAFIGAAVSLANYFSPDSGIAGTPGAILVIASTIFLLGFGLVMRGYAGQGRLFRALVTAFAFADIVGTALAGYLLDSETLVALMMVCLVGWLAHIFRPRPLLV